MADHLTPEDARATETLTGEEARRVLAVMRAHTCHWFYDEPRSTKRGPECATICAFCLRRTTDHADDCTFEKLRRLAGEGEG